MLTINNRLNFIVTLLLQYLMIAVIWYVAVHLLEDNPTITNVDRILQIILSLFSTIFIQEGFKTGKQVEAEE